MLILSISLSSHYLLSCPSAELSDEHETLAHPLLSLHKLNDQLHHIIASVLGHFLGRQHLNERFKDLVHFWDYIRI